MSRLEWRNRLAIASGIVLLVSFFLPWVTLLGGDQVIQAYTGYTMATRESDAWYRRDFEGYSVNEYVGRPYSLWLLLLPASALLVSVLGVIGIHRERAAPWARRASLLLATIVPLTVVTTLLSIRAAIYHPALRFQTHYGLWIAAVGLLTVWAAVIAGQSRRHIAAVA